MNSMLTLSRQWVNLLSVKSKLFAKADELCWCRDNVVDGEVFVIYRSTTLSNLITLSLEMLIVR